MWKISDRVTLTLCSVCGVTTSLVVVGQTVEEGKDRQDRKRRQDRRFGGLPRQALFLRLGQGVTGGGRRLVAGIFRHMLWGWEGRKEGKGIWWWGVPVHTSLSSFSLPQARFIPVSPALLPAYH